MGLLQTGAARTISRHRIWPEKLGRFASHCRAHVSASLQIRRIGSGTWINVPPHCVQPVSERIHEMTNGTVKFYNGQKGFGFIQPEDGGKDVFVHATALERAGIQALREGQKVSFDT